MIHSKNDKINSQAIILGKGEELTSIVTKLDESKTQYVN